MSRLPAPGDGKDDPKAPGHRPVTRVPKILILLAARNVCKGQTLRAAAVFTRAVSSEHQETESDEGLAMSKGDRIQNCMRITSTGVPSMEAEEKRNCCRLPGWMRCNFGTA